MNEHVQTVTTEPLFNPLSPDFIRIRIRSTSGFVRPIDARHVGLVPSSPAGMPRPVWFCATSASARIRRAVIAALRAADQ